MASPSPTAVLSLGRSFFGAATIASGVLQLVTGDFVRLVPKLPTWVPSPTAWAYLFGIVLVVIGLAIASHRKTGAAASVLGVLILADVLLLYAPQMVVNPVVDRPFFRGFMWTNPLKCLALVGGLAILAARSPEGESPLSALVRRFGRLGMLGPVLLALFLFVCGMQHFVYRDFVVTMIPSWIPEPRFWTYFTGVALMAGGAGILFPPTARLAPTMAGVMIFLWVLLLHVPRALAGPNHANETAGTFEALALSGVAFLVAGTAARSAESEGAIRARPFGHIHSS